MKKYAALLLACNLIAVASYDNLAKKLLLQAHSPFMAKFHKKDSSKPEPLKNQSPHQPTSNQKQATIGTLSKQQTQAKPQQKEKEEDEKPEPLLSRNELLFALGMAAYSNAEGVNTKAGISYILMAKFMAWKDPDELTNYFQHIRNRSQDIQPFVLKVPLHVALTNLFRNAPEERVQALGVSAEQLEAQEKRIGNYVDILEEHDRLQEQKSWKEDTPFNVPGFLRSSVENVASTIATNGMKRAVKGTRFDIFRWCICDEKPKTGEPHSWKCWVYQRAVDIAANIAVSVGINCAVNTGISVVGQAGDYVGAKVGASVAASIDTRNLF